MRRPNRRPNYTKTEDIENWEIPPDWIIYKDDADTVAVNGDTGRENSRNTNSTTVIQYALDHYKQVAAGVGARNNTIFLKSGRYIIDDVLSIPESSLIFRGSGSNTYTTEIYLKDGTDIVAMFEYDCTAAVGENTFKVFEDLKINGNHAGGTATADALYWHGTRPWDTWFNRIYIANTPGCGIRVTGTHDMWVTDSIFEYTHGGYGVNIAGNRIFVTGNYFGANVLHGLRCSSTYNFISNNVFTGQGRISIYIDSGDYSTIIGNIMRGNHTAGAENFGDIYVYDHNLATIMGNVIVEGDEIYNHGITINGLVDSIISGNVIKGATTPIHISGTNTNTIIRGNTGYISENSGTAIMLNGSASIIVPHGLNGTPTVVNVTGQHSEVLDIYVDTIGAANFTITTIGGNVTADRNIFWEAKVR